ncbi:MULTISPECIES: co-chaperone YbbN [Flavobacterium]|uniref:Thioredoxin family protein n=2 Tax=Flavobacterium TaxID=237 RepID=A0ABW8PM93_9FLAO|nr:MULTISPECIES: thioredoxin family protein [Flavobacterium]QYS89101.1 thioredoxin family protein [Flavobacterium davisii]SPE77843.1 Thioredoxin [Flavobacterium columnare]
MKLPFTIAVLLISFSFFGQTPKNLVSDKQEKIKLEKLTIEKYNQLLSKDSIIIVDFNAKWCGPCKKLAPILEKVSKEKKIKLIKIDTDKNPELAQKLNVEGLPTLHYYKNGKLIWENLGFITEAELIKKLN